MKILKISLIVFLMTGYIYGQIQDPRQKQTQTQQQQDLKAPQIDLSGFDVLKMIEPGTGTSTMFNEQILEGAVNPNKYFVGPNDVFSLGIWGVLNQGIPLSVSPEGSLIIPSVGEVSVNGLTLTEAKSRVIAKVRQRYISSEISLTLVSPRRFTITVTGVGQGIYPTSAVLRASSIISFIVSDSLSLLKSGTSPGERALFSLRNIKLKRKNGQTFRIDLYKYFATQDDIYNPFLLEGDVINIPKYDVDERFLSVYGAVQFPGMFEYIEGDDLETAIQLVRGVTSTGNTDSILVSRLDPGGMKMNNFYVSLEQDKYMKLQKNDRIIVLSKPDLRRDYKVTVLGEVIRPGGYPITINTTKISDIIHQAGGLTPNAYLPTSELYRKVDTLFMRRGDTTENILTQRLNDIISNKDEKEMFEQENKFKISRVNIDFDRISQDPSQDVVLHHEDIIYIADNKKQVYVYGQVNKPGFVPFVEGANFEYYIDKAGGFGERADEDEARVIKFKTREWVEPDEAKIQSNDFIYVPKVIKKDFAFDLDLVAKVASVVVSVITLTLLIIQSQK